MIKINELVGMKKEDAIKQLKEANFIARITAEDGESFLAHVIID